MLAIFVFLTALALAIADISGCILLELTIIR